MDEMTINVEYGWAFRLFMHDMGIPYLFVKSQRFRWRDGKAHGYLVVLYRDRVCIDALDKWEAAICLIHAYSNGVTSAASISTVIALNATSTAKTNLVRFLI